MNTKIYLTLLICLIIMLSTGCDKNNVNSGYSTITKSSNIDSQSKDNELLYGKYPEPILIAIGENSYVKKDYKELTRNDLKKIKYLSFIGEYGMSCVGKKYGFEENKEYDFSIILEMPNLTSLSIDFESSNVRLKDYSILKKLNNLQKLSISNIHDSDIGNISAQNSLEWLSISYSDLTNINFLERLSQLKFFFLEYTPNIKNYEALKYLNSVGSINLNYSNITEKELSTVPDINTLIGFGLVGNNLTNVTDFPVFKNLISLGLSINPIESIKIPSDNLPKLKHLNISDTLIADINNIKGMDSIEEIIIKNTKIVKVAPFKKYKNLKFINATLSNIRDKDTLEGTNIGINEE